MNAIEIVITGVVYLLGASQASQPVDVVIPNIAMASAPHGQVLTEHYAYVKVKTGDIDSCTAPCLRAPDFLFKKATGATEFAYYALRGDQITLTGGNLTPSPLVICTDADCGRKVSELNPGESDELKSYHSIPHHKDVCPTCGSLDNDYLSSADAALIAARLTLARGKLSAGNFDNGGEWTFLPSRFRFSEVTYHKQKVADQAVLQAEADGPVTLTVRPLVGDALGTKTLTLVLKNTAQIEIGNLMPNDAVPMGHIHPEAVDVHFGAFYRMMNRPVPADPPIPHRYPFPIMDPGGARANCIPLRGTR